MKALISYSWPGNVRQLENEVKRALVLCATELVGVEDLSEAIRESNTVAEPTEDSPVTGEVKKFLKDRVTALEIQMIREALINTQGDRRKTAKQLGLSHQGLINKVKRYGLE